MIGRWEVDRNEPDCVTFWNWYKDKVCTYTYYVNR